MSRENQDTPEGQLELLQKKVTEYNGDLKIVHYEFFEDQYRILAGRILTIIDASIAEKQQNKCVKDLVKSEFYRRINELQDFYYQGKKGHSVNLENKGSDPLS